MKILVFLMMVLGLSLAILQDSHAESLDIAVIQVPPVEPSSLGTTSTAPSITIDVPTSVQSSVSSNALAFPETLSSTTLTTSNVLPTLVNAPSIDVAVSIVSNPVLPVDSSKTLEPIQPIPSENRWSDIVDTGFQACQQIQNVSTTLVAKSDSIVSTDFDAYAATRGFDYVLAFIRANATPPVATDEKLITGIVSYCASAKDPVVARRVPPQEDGGLCAFFKPVPVSLTES